MGQVDPHSTRQRQPRGESWWLLRFDNKRRQTDAQQQSHSPNRASGLAGKTWSIVDMEGFLGDGRKPNQLHHQSHLPCSSHAQERKPVVWRRSFPCPLSNPCNTESHSHRLQNHRYTWRHSKVLRQLAITLEGRRTTNNALPPPMPRHTNTIPFVRAGQLPAKSSARMEATLLVSARDWKMQVDPDQKLIFPPEIITTSLRPDLVLWSTSQRVVFIVELTVPWEASVGEAHEH